ncbi:hypothetical protein GCM10027059_15100 [Myceligenerans halotolerans]
MRLVGADLGVEAASLYKHVTSKDDLAAGVAELIWEEIAQAAPPDDDWAAWLRALAHAIRDVIRRHPGTVSLWVGQSVAPVPALELFDAQLQCCRPDAREEGAQILRVVTSYAIGFATSELSWFPAPGAGALAPGATTSAALESDAQRISRVARALPADAPNHLIDVALLVCTGDTTDMFETGLDLMIKGLALPGTGTPRA